MMARNNSLDVPSRRARIFTAIAIAVAAATLSIAVQTKTRPMVPDFNQIWIAGRALMRGENPYVAVPRDFGWPLFYPLPGVVLAFPFIALPRILAAAAWVGCGVGSLAYLLSARGWWALIGLASMPLVDAVVIGQWSPLMTACALSPWLAWLAIGKPTTGGATVVAFAPSLLEQPNACIWSACAAATVILISFVLLPAWALDWLAAVRGAHHIVPLILRPGGILLLAALIRWRRPEARLLAMLAIAPQTTAPYDAVPLVLCVGSRREALIFALLSFSGMSFFQSRVGHGAAFEAAQAHNAPILLVTQYLPVLVMVLLRPNQGQVPKRLERLALRLPPWLRGTRADESYAD